MADLAAVQNAGQSVDVVGVEVGEDEQRHLLDPE